MKRSTSMMKIRVPFLAVCLCSCAASGQTPEPSSPASPPEARPAIKILRFDENWEALRDPRLRTDRLDALKYIPLGAPKQDRFLSIGGEVRGVYERVQNDNWSSIPYATNSFGLERFQLHSDFRFNPHVRLFLQLESGLEQGRSGGPRPIDKKDLDFLNAFLELSRGSEKQRTFLRIGRQELNLGSGRLVAVREGPNVRQGFYGVRINQRISNWTLDELAVRPAQDNPGFFDNVPLHSTGFWGLFSERASGKASSSILDFYYFGLDRKSATFNRGTAREQRQTVGVRAASSEPSTTDSRRVIPHYDLEAAYQFGSFGSSTIQAWTMATELGLSFPKLPAQPRVGLRADISSGDGQKGSNLGTFNPLFPIGNYFGVLADTGPGPINFRDIHPDLRLSHSHGISVDADWVVWWRQSTLDGVYGVPGNLLVPAGQSDARFVGHRPGVEVRWQRDRHFYVQADYGIFFAGPFLRESGRTHNLNYTSFWTGYKF